ncbi:MAG: ROK family protein [Defluviitaleaceae bacterium]|nr:ROK family protein [Defluviitaleaceae bacterium]
MNNILALDFGGTSIKYGLYDSKGDLIGTEDSLQIERYISLSEILKNIEKIIKHYRKIDGIAIAMPGNINSKEGIISQISAIPCFNNINLKHTLNEIYNLPVAIENDANCATLAEFWIGNGNECSNIAVITIGTGIGGGIIINKELYHGSHNFSGEFGIMITKPIGHSTYTSYGYNSSIQLIKRAAKIDENIKNGEDFFENLHREEIKNLYDEWIHGLSMGIFNIGISLDPDKILIGGGVSSRQIIYPEIKKYLDSFSNFKYHFVVEPCLFFNNSGKIGAVYNLLKQEGIVK